LAKFGMIVFKFCYCSNTYWENFHCEERNAFGIPPTKKAALEANSAKCSSGADSEFDSRPRAPL